MDFLETWNNLSSTGLVNSLVELLGSAGTWAGAAADLIGLVI